MDKTIYKQILELTKQPVTLELLRHVCSQVIMVIPCYEESKDRTAPEEKYDVLPPLASFINFLVKRAYISAGTLLASLVFFKRLQQTLSHIAKGMPCTSHRIFLATLIVTSKSLHDTSPKNKHWARYASYFTVSEINLMEKQLLSLLNFDVLISPSDLASVYYEFRRVTLPPSISQLNFAKTASAAVAYSFINDADIPTYAAIYSCKTKQSSLSSTSLNSDISNESDSSISTPSDEQDVKRYYSKSSKSPPKAHCRSRKATHVNILLYEGSES
ncbi:hypothetical protein EDC96DRAFT_214045 [Choanephora cucurbitarum]|nr:hypothetical protein EDC96DRAFT_214045 [Choanephora cucurbitarum]